MVNYRKKSTPRRDDKIEEPHHASAQIDEAYMELVAEYGLNDMSIGNPDDNPEQTIEDEYRAYVTAPLSPKKVTSLKFWEVRGNIQVNGMDFSY